MFVEDEKAFSDYLFVLNEELKIISKTGNTFRGGRTAASWVRDVICLTELITNKKEPPRDLEYMFFKLISFCPALYENFDSLGQSYKQMCNLYRNLLATRDRFANYCHTLIKVEDQQKAKERASRKAGKPTKITEDEISQFRNRFWKRLLEKDHPFFKDISNYALKFEKDILSCAPKSKEGSKKASSQKRRSSEYTEEDWHEKLWSIFCCITHYPVSSMLMPVLLAKYVVDDMENEYESVYAYMKCRESSFPRNSSIGEFKENIQLLYNAIEKRIDELDDEWVDPFDKQLSAEKRAKAPSRISGADLFRVIDATYHEYKRTAFGRGLPIISLPDILDVLEEKFQDNDYPYNRDQLWRLLVEYTAKNGLRYGDLKTGFTDVERIIISVALLYNAEFYLNYKFEVVSNKDVLAALNYLNDKHIIESRTSESESDANKYLSMYKSFFATFPILERDLSPLALCKYFKLDAWSSLEQIELFKTLHFEVTKNLTAAKDGILSTFYSTSEEVYFPPIVSVDAYDDLLKMFNIMKKGLLTNKKDAAEDSDGSNGYVNELEAFVVQPDNFTYWGFQEFIKSKEESDADLWKEFRLPIQYREEIVCKLFEFTIDLIISRFHAQVRQYCVKQLEWYSHEDVCKNSVASTTPKSKGGNSQ